MDIWTTIVSMVTGASCFIFFIGQVAAILSGINSSSLAYDEKLAEVGEYLNFRRVPRSLRMRVKNYYDHKCVIPLVDCLTIPLVLIGLLDFHQSLAGNESREQVWRESV